MLTIRLQRIGKKKFPTYRLIISEKGRDTRDMYLEQLGTYNPHVKENAFAPNAERITYWLGKGAQTSDTIHNLLVTAGIIKANKKKAVFLSAKRKEKLAEKNKAKPAAVQAAAPAMAEAPVTAAEAPAAAEPAPAQAPENPAPEMPATS